MKYFGFVLAIAVTFFSNGQVSYEFQQPVPPRAETVQTVSASLYGEYKNEETGTVYHIDETGISMVSILYSFITREQLRESTKYMVRNDFIFGVVANDSLPCVLEGERYFFGIRQKAVVTGTSATNVLMKVSESAYVLNFREANGYSPSMLTFSGNTLTMRHFDYPSGTTLFDGVKTKKTIPSAQMNTQLLSPSSEEWKKLDATVMFGQGILYTR